MPYILLNNLSWVLKLVKLLLRRCHNLVNQVDNYLNLNFDQKKHNYLVKRTASRYDMTVPGDEKYYADFYGNFIDQEISRNYRFKELDIHDLACGQGRTIMTLLEKESIQINTYHGVDFTKEAILAAQRNIKRYPSGLVTRSNINFHRADIMDYLAPLEDGSVKFVLLLEVIYMMPDPLPLMAMVARKLAPGGLLIISLRSDYYYILSLISQGLVRNASVIESSSSGEIYGSGVRLNWTNSREIISGSFFKLGLRLNRMTGVGVFSGIQGDPLSGIIKPSQLTVNEQGLLAGLEEKYGEIYPDNGRYLLCSLSKESVSSKFV